MTFSIEVRVKAAELPSIQKTAARLANAQEIQEIPKNCLNKEGVCAIKTLPSEKFTLEIAAGKVILDSATSIIRNSDKQIEFVSGVLWVKANQEISIRTEYGEVIVQKDSQAWFSRAKECVKIATIDGYVTVNPRGGHQPLGIEAGFENTLGKVDSSGVAETAAPVAIDFKAHIERWARLFEGRKSDFENEVEEFHRLWSASREKAAQLHQELYQRKVASIVSEQTAQAQAKKIQAERSREVRKTFRQHYYEALGLGSEPAAP